MAPPKKFLWQKSRLFWNAPCIVYFAFLSSLGTKAPRWEGSLLTVCTRRNAGRTRLAHAVNHPRNSDLQLHTRSKTLEMKSCSCTRGQKGRTVALRLVQTVKRDLYQWGAFVPNENENAKYKKSLFLQLFKNTIFTMYEWWRFQPYRICLKNLEIKISIEKLYFFLVHLERSIKKN